MGIKIDNVLYTKEHLLNKIKNYLKNSNEGIITNPIFERRLLQLLMLHPNAKRKIRRNIKHFAIEKNHEGSGKSFVIIYDDHSTERFSYKKCIIGKTSTKRSEAVEAFRFIVRPQLQKFRDSIKLPIKCAITNQIIISRINLEIDHKIPFSKLLNDFCLDKNISLTNIPTIGNGEILQLVDQNISQEFYDYHLTHAVLQPVTKEINREKSNKLHNLK